MYFSKVMLCDGFIPLHGGGRAVRGTALSAVPSGGSDRWKKSSAGGESRPRLMLSHIFLMLDPPKQQCCLRGRMAHVSQFLFLEHDRVERGATGG